MVSSQGNRFIKEYSLHGPKRQRRWFNNHPDNGRRPHAGSAPPDVRDGEGWILPGNLPDLPDIDGQRLSRASCAIGELRMPSTPGEVSADEKRKGGNRNHGGIRISTKNPPGRDGRLCWHLLVDYRCFVSTSPHGILHFLYTHSTANHTRAGTYKPRTSCCKICLKN